MSMESIRKGINSIKENKCERIAKDGCTPLTYPNYILLNKNCNQKQRLNNGGLAKSSQFSRR
jgi:hypothetical protein